MTTKNMARFKDVPVGQSFRCHGRTFTRENDLGEHHGICNAKDDRGGWVHFDFEREVELI